MLRLSLNETQNSLLTRAFISKKESNSASLSRRHPRRSCFSQFPRALPYLWHACSNRSHSLLPPFRLLQLNGFSNEFSAPLCSCSGTRGQSRGHKKPRRPDGTSGRRLELAFLIGAALAPRCCPLPVSSTVAVVNASLAQRNRYYTASAAVSTTSRVASLPASAD
jgi:hypothetical protein